MLALWPLAAGAGAQLYEPLSDSVRVRLSKMVSDRAPATMHFRSATDGQRWLAEMDRRLAQRIPLEPVTLIQLDAGLAKQVESGRFQLVANENLGHVIASNRPGEHPLRRRHPRPRLQAMTHLEQSQLQRG